MAFVRIVKNDAGFVVVCGRKVLFRWISRRKVLCRAYAILRFQEAREDLLQRGCRLPSEAAPRWTGRYCVDFVKLGELRRPQFRQLGGGSLPLEDTLLVKYLRTGDEQVLAEYERLHVQYGIFPAEKMKGWRICALQTFASVEKDGYDPMKSCIVIKENGDIADGYHRAAALYAKFGPDHEIKVVRILGNVRFEGLM